jgi:Family of unknown function (DUF6221)
MCFWTFDEPVDDLVRSSPRNVELDAVPRRDAGTRLSTIGGFRGFSAEVTWLATPTVSVPLMRERVWSDVQRRSKTWERRVLADCDGKRRVIALYVDARRHHGTGAQAMSLGLRDALCLPAPAYSGHPDFQEQWMHHTDHPDFHDG